MKNSILLIVLMLVSLSVMAQARLNSSASEVRAEFSDSRYNLRSGIDSDGDYYIKIDTERATVYYYFDESRICFMTAIVPDDQGALNYYAELYNKRYVIMSSTRWKMYSESGIANIELVYTDDGWCYFLWRR